MTIFTFVYKNMIFLCHFFTPKKAHLCREFYFLYCSTYVVTVFLHRHSPFRERI